MAISQTQLVDILYKKLSGVSKTDTSTAKSPSNEANASPQLSPGSTIWQQDYAIPSVTVLPSSNSSAVTVYRDSLSSAVQTTVLSESIANETWTTNLTNWIPPQFGAGYQVKLYAGPSGSSTPSNYINLPPAGSGNSDSWYFDYAAGIVNFADTNVPTAVTGANVVYVVGARYTGVTGITTFANLQIANVSISGNTITGNANGLSFGSNVTAGNLTITNLYNSNGTLFSNYGNTQVAQYLPTYTGNITAGNITSNSVTIVNGLFWSNGVSALAPTYGNTQVGAYLSVYTGNVTAANVISSNVYVDTIFPDANAVTIFGTTSAVGLPVGGNVARPSSPNAGQIRYNSDYASIEFYNGTGWVSIINSIDGQNFFGDGSTQTFTLNHYANSNGIIVNINGTIQQPNFAYTVSGNQITFSQAPSSTDQIDIRFLAAAEVGQYDTPYETWANVQLTNLSANITAANSAVSTYETWANVQLTNLSANITAANSAVSALANTTVVATPNIVVNTTTTIVDSFNSGTYRSARYIISSTSPYDSQMSEIMLVQNNGTVIINNFGILNTGGNTVSYYANINGSTVNLLANSTTNSNQLRIQKMYFII
jgi:hypothetical protein